MASDTPFSFFGYGDGERLGISLAVGEVTGDDIADLIVGAGGPTGVAGEWRDPLTNAGIGALSAGYQAIYLLAGDHSFPQRRHDAFAGDWTTAIVTAGGRALSLITGKYDMPCNTGASQDLLFGSPFFSPGGAIDQFGGSILTSTRTRPRPPWIPDIVDYRGFGDQQFNPVKNSRAGLGFSVASGDVNGDGASDMIAAAPFANGPGGIECGVVEIWFGIPKPPNPAPSITSVSPNSGPAAGGTSLLVSGSNFRSGIRLTLGGVDATDVLLASPTLLTATSPPHAAGTVDLVVTNPDGTNSTLAGGFTYTGRPTPLISSASVQGKNLIVVGQNFDLGAVLIIDSVPRKTINDDASPTTTLIGRKIGKAIAPGQTVMIQVQNASGATSPGFSFTRPAG